GAGADRRLSGRAPLDRATAGGAAVVVGSIRVAGSLVAPVEPGHRPGMMAMGDTDARQILTPTALNRLERQVLDDTMPTVWVEGELSNVARPASGHVYFTLKDAGAQVRCAIFRARAQLLRFRPADGLHVRLRGRVGLYEPRGEYQLIADHMEQAGEGALQRAFAALKERLAAEGLFAADRK